MMNFEERNFLEGKIKTKIEDLTVEIKELEELVKPLDPDNTLSGLTRMENINNKNINEGSLALAKTKLFKLENALKNIHTPNFGICVSCKGVIPFKRILALPESLICVDCAED